MIRLLEDLSIRYFSDGTNVALNKPAWQSSINRQGVASHAVDGNRSADTGVLSCSVMVNQNSPWWIVNLESEYDIYRIVITLRERGNTLNGFLI